MKHDVNSWYKSDGSVHSFAEGRLWCRACDHNTAWYIDAGDGPVLVHVGWELDTVVSIPGLLTVVTPKKGGDWYFYERLQPSSDRAPESYTNADRLPHESGAVLAVKQAAREQLHLMREERKRLSSISRDLQAALQRNAPASDIAADPVVVAPDEDGDQVPETDT